MTENSRDLTRTTLALFFIVGLVLMSLWVLRPFLAATVWATMIVVATWPMFKSIEHHLGGRRAPAVLIMTLALLLLLVIPLWAAIDIMVENSGRVADVFRDLARNGLPQPPDWIAELPLVGEKLFQTLSNLGTAGSAGLFAKLSPYAADSGKWLLSQVGGVGGALIHFILIAIIAAILYSYGETGARSVLRFGRRLAGERGENAVILAGQAIRAVALGVGITAIVQSTLGGIGLAVAGVPFASLLTALMLMLCIAQLGPSLVLFPAVGWLYWSGETGWATALLVWSVAVGSLDNVLRPVLIKRGADLPMLLIFAGVIGGMIGFGLIGIFVGPVILAVTYTLLQAWIEDGLGKHPD